MMAKLFVFALLVLAAVSAYAETICEPGSVTKVDCNSCRCSAAGDQLACTRKICPPASRKKRAPRDGERCEPGRRFADECNMCICSQDGIKAHASCTINICRRTKRDSCTPGTRWQQDCNTCTCTENGVAVCTLKACLNRPIRQLPSESCEPGSTFKKDCNTCTCSANGKTAACTLKFCLPQSRRRRDSQKCEPGRTFQKDCNTCRCSEDGKSEVCTLRFCVPNPDTWSERCKAGTRWKDDCNLCFCTSNGQVACTKMLCVHENNIVGSPSSPAVIDKQVNFGYRCKPGIKFMEGCKTCWCSSDGLTSNCKPDTCPPEVSRQKRGIEFALRCDPGEIFKRDCNTCICSVDGIADHASCTIHQCRRHKRRVARKSKSHDASVQVCEPGKNFQKDCNTCLCSNDGTEASCTLMTCPPPSNLTEKPSDSRRCKPGSFYKKGCNRCRCSKDGKTEVCTLKACQSKNLALLHVKRSDK